MIEIIVNIFNWIVQGIQDILGIITTIPNYVTGITNLLLYVPWQIRYALVVILTATVLIHIKRLVFN